MSDTVCVYRCGNPHLRGALVGLGGLSSAAAWLAGNGNGRPLALLFTVITAFNGWLWLYQVAYELRLQGGFVHAECALVKRAVSVERISTIRSGRIDPGVGVIEADDGAAVYVSVGPDFAAFVGKIAATNPAVVVSLVSHRVRTGVHSSLTERDLEIDLSTPKAVIEAAESQ